MTVIEEIQQDKYFASLNGNSEKNRAPDGI